MTRHLIRLAAACCLALAALGYGCSSGGPAVDTTTYCGKAAVALCANMFACCTSEQRETTLGEENVNDEAKCQHDLEVSCEIDIAETLYAMDKGTVKYTESKATECIDSIKHPADSCALVAEEAPHEIACKESPFEGQVAEGGDCHWTVECVKGAACVSGKCEAPPKENENCTFSCAEGLYCKAGKCAQRVGSGTACTTDSMCQDGLYCDTTCKALKSPGTACEEDGECVTDDCGGGTCADGSGCDSDFDCDGKCKKSGDSCFSDLGCDSYCEKSGNSCYSAAGCDTATAEPCVDDTCENTCSNRVCAAKPLKVYDYCKLGN